MECSKEIRVLVGDDFGANHLHFCHSSSCFCTISAFGLSICLNISNADFASSMAFALWLSLSKDRLMSKSQVPSSQPVSDLARLFSVPVRSIRWPCGLAQIRVGTAKVAQVLLLLPACLRSREQFSAPARNIRWPVRGSPKSRVGHFPSCTSVLLHLACLRSGVRFSAPARNIRWQCAARLEWRRHRPGCSGGFLHLARSPILASNFQRLLVALDGLAYLSQSSVG